MSVENFNSRAVRSMVDLHEREMRRFLETWERFVKAGASMPESRGDPNYASPDHLVGHVARSPRNYLTWIGEVLKRPVTDVDPETDVAKIGVRYREFVEGVLAAWRRHLPAVQDSELGPELFRTRWNAQYTVDTMLEHAIVHPMRHRIQLERMMGERSAFSRGS